MINSPTLAYPVVPAHGADAAYYGRFLAALAEDVAAMQALESLLRPFGQHVWRDEQGWQRTIIATPTMVRGECDWPTRLRRVTTSLQACPGAAALGHGTYDGMNNTPPIPNPEQIYAAKELAPNSALAGTTGALTVWIHFVHTFVEVHGQPLLSLQQTAVGAAASMPADTATEFGLPVAFRLSGAAATLFTVAVGAIELRHTPEPIIYDPGDIGDEILSASPPSSGGSSDSSGGDGNSSSPWQSQSSGQSGSSSTGVSGSSGLSPSDSPSSSSDSPSSTDSSSPSSSWNTSSSSSGSSPQSSSSSGDNSSSWQSSSSGQSATSSQSSSSPSSSLGPSSPSSSDPSLPWESSSPSDSSSPSSSSPSSSSDASLGGSRHSSDSSSGSSSSSSSPSSSSSSGEEFYGSSDSSSSKIIMPVNVGGELAFVGWCAVEAPNQQLEVFLEIEAIGRGEMPLPVWMVENAHPDRPNWQIVSAWAPTGDLVAATFEGIDEGLHPHVVVRVASWADGSPVLANVIVRLRCASKASLEPWQEEPDPRRRAASKKFHASTRRHHGKSA